MQLSLGELVLVWIPTRSLSTVERQSLMPASASWFFVECWVDHWRSSFFQIHSSRLQWSAGLHGISHCRQLHPQPPHSL